MNSPRIRVVLAISLDGRIALHQGGATHLGGKEDRNALEESLAWADGALIGGGTLRAHRTTCLIHSKKLLDKRQLEGRPKQPIAVVVSSQKGFSNNWPFFYQPIERWLLSREEPSINCPNSENYARKFKLDEDWSTTLQKLQKAGLSRLVLLGGAYLIGSFLEDDLIDELQLTLIPKILGGDHGWVPKGIKNLPSKLWASNAWHLKENKCLGENELLLRYLRNRSTNQANKVLQE